MISLPHLGTIEPCRNANDASGFKTYVTRLEAWIKANNQSPTFAADLLAIELTWQGYLSDAPSAEETAMAFSRIAAAKHMCAMTYPYLGPSFYAMRFIATNMPYAMACDEKWRVYYAPRYINMFTTSEVVFILCHELAHLLRYHHTRSATGRLTWDTQNLWSVATDLEINDDEIQNARDRNDETMEYYCVYPAKYKKRDGTQMPDNLSAEEYFRELQDNPHVTPNGYPKDGQGPEGMGKNGEPQKGQAPGKGACGTCSGKQNADMQPGGGDEAGLDPSTIDRIAHDAARRIKEASASQGSVPAGWQRWAETYGKPVVNWRVYLPTLLRKAIQEATSQPSNYTYRKPHRRAELYQPFFAASMVGHEVGILFQVDTSGSMSDGQLGTCLTEIMGAMRQLNSKVIVASVDAKVHNTIKTRNIKDIKLQGGGGTDMTHGMMELIEKHRKEIDVVVVMTDCHTGWPTEAPDLPVIIVNVGTGAPPPWKHKIINVDPKGFD